MGNNDNTPADVLRTLERTLRGYIRFRLSLVDYNWWKSRVQADMRTKCEERKEKQESQWPWDSPEDSHPVAFADFDFYGRILTQKRNWNEVFQVHLGEEKIIAGKFRELELVRPVIAHNRPLPADAEKQFRFNAQYVLKLLDLDSEFQQFIRTIGAGWEELVESCREEDAILILAGNPWLLGQDTQFKERNSSLGSKYPDLLFESDDGFRTYVEVKRNQLDVKQILGYADLLKSELAEKKCRLVWFIPQTLSGTIGKSVRSALDKSRVDVIEYDIGFFTRWAFLRVQARTALANMHDDLSSPFRYTLGRTTHEFFHYDFRNVSDALYFYGYVERDDKRTKTGFHLATLGWNLDLLRNLSASNFRYFDTNPELTLKLVLEVLEYPYLYQDPKKTARQLLRATGVLAREGFAGFLEGYIKKGRITAIKDMVRKHHQVLREVYAQRLVPFLEGMKAKYPLSEPLLALRREDILERMAERIGRAVLKMGALPAGGFRDEVIRFLKLEESILTEEIAVAGQTVRNTRVDDRGTYRANMAKRLVEIMALKRILNVHSYIQPRYQILAFVNDRPVRQGVQTFKINMDAGLRKSYLR